MNHSSAHDLVAGYVLDALSAADQAAFEAHLRDCALCRAEVAHLATVSEALGSAKSVEPPPELENAVMAGLSPAAAPSRRRWIPALAAAAVVLFTAGIGVGVIVQSTTHPSEKAAAMSVVSAPDAVAMPLAIDGWQASVVVSRETDAAAVLGSDVPMPADGGVYIMWQKFPDGSLTVVGTFQPTASGHVAEPLSGSVSDTEMYLLTVEPEPGMTHPTSPPIAEVPV